MRKTKLLWNQKVNESNQLLMTETKIGNFVGSSDEEEEAGSEESSAADEEDEEEEGGDEEEDEDEVSLRLVSITKICNFFFIAGAGIC